jgi:hypothetical protein
MMRRTVPWLVHVGLPLGLGLGFYVAFRGLEVPILAWMASLEGIETIRARTLPLVSRVPAFINASFVDAMAAYALGSALSLVWRHEVERRGWLLLGLFVALGFEFVQVPEAVPGVFSWIDVVAILLFYPLGVALVSWTFTSWKPRMLPTE